MKLFRTGLTLLFLVFILSACVSAPKGTLESNSNDFGQSKAEKKLLETSAQIIEEMENKGVLVRNPVLVSYVQSLGEKFVPDSLHKQMTLRFYVMRDPSPNAFALPNGGIFVTTGLLSTLESEGQLAFILCHELTHVIERHSLEIKSERASQVGAAHVLDILLMGSGLAYIGALQEVSTFSQDQEFSADLSGLERVVRGGYGPESAIRALTVLGEETATLEKGKNPYSTHPPFKERIARLQEVIKTQNLSGNSPSSESFEASQFLARKELYKHLTRMKQYQNARELVESLLVDHRQDTDLYIALGDILRARIEDPKAMSQKVRAKKVVLRGWQNAAHQAYDKALKQSPGHPEAHRGKGLLYFFEGKEELAEKQLRIYLAQQEKPRDRRYIMHILKKCEMKEDKK